MTADELASAEAELKSAVIAPAFAIGLAFGIAVWSATHGGFVLPVILAVVAVSIGARSAPKARELRMIKAEKLRRSAAH